MGHRLSVLQNIEIASPCAAGWADMAGDDRVRFCERCGTKLEGSDVCPSCLYEGAVPP